MKELFDAIFAKYNASSVPAHLTALYNTEADSNAQFPYAVLQLVVGGAADFASGEHYTENWLVQFNLFEKGPNMAAILEAFAALITAFDSTSLAIAGHKFLSCRRPPGSTRQTKVEGVWQITVQFRIEARAQ